MMSLRESKISRTTPNLEGVYYRAVICTFYAHLILIYFAVSEQKRVKSDWPKFRNI